MFQEICTTAFYAFMCIGEITGSKQTSDVLELSQVTKLSNASGSIASFKLTFHQFKHHYNQHPVSIIIPCQPGVCPFEDLLRYFSLRGTVPGPYSQHMTGAPLTRTEFDEWFPKNMRAIVLGYVWTLMRRQVVIQIVRSAYSGGGSRTLLRGIFAFLAFQIAYHFINRKLKESNLAVG